MAGNFTSLAARLVDARRAVETKFDDDTGKPKRRSCTPSSKFIKEICGLIPSDLLLATNFYWSPKLICSSEVSKLQRYSDVESMLHRIALWYEFMLPADDGSNSDDIRILLNLREWFDQLDRATKEHMQSLNQARNSGKASDCDDDCRCEICGYCCFYGCDTCTRCLFEVEKQFHTNQGVADAVGGGSYSGGAVGLVNGEFGGYFAASSNQQCHDWCRGVCGGEFANICCFCVQSDKGTAAAVNGGPPPNNCCGQMSFHTAKCVEETRGCYCGCFQEIGNICCTCGEGLVQVIQGLGTGIQRLCEGFSRTLCNCDGSMCHAVAHIFDFDCSGFNGCCQNLDCGNCSGCNCDCGEAGEFIGKGILTLLGLGAGAGGIAYDAAADDTTSEQIGDDSIDPTEGSTAAVYVGSIVEHISRRLGTQSSVEYTPSIVFMIFILVVFAPRIVSNLLYALINIKQGVNYDRNIKSVVMVVFFAIPFSILIGGLAGASRWTFTSLAFLFMHFTYRLVTFRHKSVHPELCDLSYFSCAEWRNLNLGHVGSGDRAAMVGRVEESIRPMLGMLSTLKAEEIRLTKKSLVLKVIHLFYPAINKFIARVSLSGEIKAAHTIIHHVGTDVGAKSEAFIPSAPPLAVEAQPIYVSAVVVEEMEGRGDELNKNEQFVF